MNKKTIIGLIAFVFLLGAALLINQTRSEAQQAVVGPAKNPPKDSPQPVGEKAESRTRSPKSAAIGELEKKFGESRTRLAGRVSATYLRLLDSMTAYAERAGRYDPSFGISQAELGPVFTLLNLSEEQQTEMERIFQGHSYEAAMNMKVFTDHLKENVPALIQALLASDAYAKGEMDTSAYEEATRPVSDMMAEANVGKDRIPGISPNDVDEALMDRNQQDVQEKMRAILSPEQIRDLDDYMAKSNVQPASDRDGASLANVIPVGNLEDLEKRVSSRAAIMDRAEALFEEMDKQRNPDGK